VNYNFLVWFMWKNQSRSKRYIFLSSMSVLHNSSFPTLYWILREIHGLQADPLYSSSCSSPLVFVFSDHFPSAISILLLVHNVPTKNRVYVSEEKNSMIFWLCHNPLSQLSMALKESQNALLLIYRWYVYVSSYWIK
jgi:hypothetical protein